VEDGHTYYVLGDTQRGAITSYVDYDNLSITNVTQPTHQFCCGSVTLSIVQDGTRISLNISGAGTNSGWFNAMENYVAGNVGFNGDIERIRANVRRWGQQ
jgi:hypothetical protein